MDIDIHFNLILKKYNLEFLFKKYIYLSLLSNTIKQSFHWFLLYFSNIVQLKPELINNFSVILLVLLGINIPVERYFDNINNNLMKEIKIANTKYFSEGLINMSKIELLNFDLVEYSNTLDNFNKNLYDYMLNIKNKKNIPIHFIKLIFIALNKNFNSLIGISIVFFFITKFINEKKIRKENALNKHYFNYDNIIRKYITNSKNFLINDEFNNEYFSKNVHQFETINENIYEINNKMDMEVNFITFFIIIIIIHSKIKIITQYDFLFYFRIIYDIESISEKVQEYYKNKIVYNKMSERYNYLNNIILSKSENKKIIVSSKINKIIINKIYNKIPNIELSMSIVIEPKEHILITGDSGSGKTSLLYVLKGIIKPSIIDIVPNIDSIKTQAYLSLPNHKSLYSSNLYDIITNYSSNPNINLINFSLQTVNLYDKLNKNDFINIESFSSGEKIRLIIARIIYNVKINNYNILLFDEIDENLNDTLSQEICLKLRDIFKDKIIIYISHNNNVKKLFKKKYFVENGIIHQ